MYGLCRVPDPGSGTPRIVLISWVGENVPESQRAACAGHLPAIRSFFREATAVISARRSEEVTLEGLRRVLAQLEPPAPRPPRRTPQDTPELVGTNYRKTNPALELQRTQRDSFWEQAEVRGRGAGEGLGGPPGSRGWGHGCCLGLRLPGAAPRGPSAELGGGRSPGLGCCGVPAPELRSLGVPVLSRQGSHCRYQWGSQSRCRYRGGAGVDLGGVPVPVPRLGQSQCEV
ncbi:drebrin-like, partial [Parus major]|uniref:drebrin-like n=1 Tax=Parus major TaxID=9157 RepID=UPI00077160E2